MPAIRLHRDWQAVKTRGLYLGTPARMRPGRARPSRPRQTLVPLLAQALLHDPRLTRRQRLPTMARSTRRTIPVTQDSKTSTVTRPRMKSSPPTAALRSTIRPRPERALLPCSARWVLPGPTVRRGSSRKSSARRRTHRTPRRRPELAVSTPLAPVYPRRHRCVPPLPPLRRRMHRLTTPLRRRSWRSGATSPG